MLRITIDELYKQELEFYTHKIAEGSITPLIFELLKETEDMEGLLLFLGYKSDETINQEEIKREDTFYSMFEKGVEVG